MRTYRQKEFFRDGEQTKGSETNLSSCQFGKEHGHLKIYHLTLQQLVMTKCRLLYRLPVHLKRICSKNCGPRSDCSIGAI